ncbi:MAG: M20/M25/M40 family metallo-hydrolase [Anaerolineaceae bacterium]|nr:M20/M25/M40 family metallo-hydrolase [Anaerolineaceae bacterium]
MPLSIDHDYITRTLVDLVRINSVNPSLAADGAGEGEIAAYIEGALRRIGLDVETQEPLSGRKNVIGMLPGAGGGRSLMLNAHTDTVGVEGMAAPFSGDIRDGRVYGRGAFDMKASAAACLGMLKALVDEGIQPGGDVYFTAVIDEEAGSAGTEAIVANYHADAAIITEPTGLRVCGGHRGFWNIEITTTGRAAHGSHYETGIDANTMMGRLLVEIEKLAQDLITQAGHPLLGPSSVHVPLIQGGTSRYVYAAQCRAELEWRSIPGEDRDSMVAVLQAFVDRLHTADPQFRATITPLFGRDSYAVAPDAPIVQAVSQAAQRIRGVDPGFYGEKWWMDSALLGSAGIETVIIGPAGGGAHAAVEWVELDSVMMFTRILAEATLDFCRAGG